MSFSPGGDWELHFIMTPWAVLMGSQPRILAPDQAKPEMLFFSLFTLGAIETTEESLHRVGENHLASLASDPSA